MDAFGQKMCLCQNLSNNSYFLCMCIFAALCVWVNVAAITGASINVLLMLIFCNTSSRENKIDET